MEDFFSIAARKKLNASDNWFWATSESVTGGFLITGSEITIGPRGGKKRKKPYDKVLITEDELRAVELEYEMKTGKCYICEGEGKEMYMWGRDIEPKYRACKRCNGSGLSLEEKKQ